MTGTEIYKRTTAFEGEADTIRLHAPQWKLLLAFDGQRSLAEVAMSIETAFAEALPLTELFLDRGWIEEQPITLDQYLKRAGATSTSAIGSAVTPSVVLHEAKPEPPTPPPTPAPPAPAVPAASVPAPPVPPPLVRAAAPVPAPATRAAVPPPLRPPPVQMPTPTPVQAVPAAATPPRAATPAAPGPMRLKAVVDYIVGQVGNSSLGQLVVYRVFLRVPPHLLQAEDIASVHLLNDQSVVQTEPLKQAIASAVMEVLKRPLPDTVYSAA